MKILENLRVPGVELDQVPFSLTALGLSEDFLEKNGINTIFFDFLSLDQKIQTVANFLPEQEEKAFLKRVEIWKSKTGNGLLGKWVDAFAGIQENHGEDSVDQEHEDYSNNSEEDLQEEEAEEEELEDYGEQGEEEFFD